MTLEDESASLAPRQTPPAWKRYDEHQMKMLDSERGAGSLH